MTSFFSPSNLRNKLLKINVQELAQLRQRNICNNVYKLKEIIACQS